MDIPFSSWSGDSGLHCDFYLFL